MGETRLVSIAARGEQPIDVVADEMAALLDAAVVGVGRLMNGFDGFSFRIGEEGDDVLMKDRSIGFEREQIVAAAGHDLFGDVGLGSHGVDGDQGALELEPLQKRGMARISLDLPSTAS